MLVPKHRVTAAATEYGWPLVALALSVAIVGPLIGIAGGDPVEAYRALVDASFGSPAGFGILLQFSVPLILVGVGVAIPLRAGMFNIGGEGQLLVGALAAVAVGVHFTVTADVPGSFVFPLGAAFLAGALMGGIAGAVKAWRGINEIITTIMLNFVAILFVQYWVTGPFKEEDLTFAATPRIAEEFALGRVGGDARIPVSMGVALLVVIAVAWAVHYTRAGWQLRLIANNPKLAERKGVGVPRLQFLAPAAGGALAGLGGGAEAIGNQMRVSEGFSPGIGFIAIAVAVLARGNILAVVPYALFFAFLRNGSLQIESLFDVPSGLVTMVVGLPVIFVAAVGGFRAYRRTQGAAV
jgi:ABC-type uncharacterized transport system permease subunit